MHSIITYVAMRGCRGNAGDSVDYSPFNRARNRHTVNGPRVHHDHDRDLANSEYVLHYAAPSNFKPNTTVPTYSDWHFLRWALSCNLSINECSCFRPTAGGTVLMELEGGGQGDFEEWNSVP